MRSIFHLIETMPWLTGSIFIIFIFVLFAISGVLLVRKFIPRNTLKVHHDVLGFVFANIGVLYSVLLGFTVVNAQQRFDKVKETSQLEAIYLSDLYHDAEIFSDTDKTRIKDAVKKYADSVIYDEWKDLANGMPNQYTSEIMNEVWNAYYKVNLTNDMQKIWYTESISKLNSLVSARISRLLGGEESLGSEMWSILIFGAFIIVGFVWFFGLESLSVHILIAVTLASTTGFLLFLIYSLDTVFTGDLSIQPEAMEKVAEMFKY